MNILDMDLSFLKANRWWFMVFGIAGGILLDPTFPTSPWYVTLGKFLTALGGLHLVVGTVDRNVDKKTDAIKVAAVAALETEKLRVDNK